MDNVIDLVAVGRASAELARWWHDFLADPEEAGEHLGQLEEARRQLQALGPVSGRLGRAVALVVAGGGPNARASVDAIELLAALADWPGARLPTTGRERPPCTASGRSRARSRSATSNEQPCLPGM